jgi:hypothetical protein
LHLRRLALQSASPIFECSYTGAALFAYNLGLSVVKACLISDRFQRRCVMEHIWAVTGIARFFHFRMIFSYGQSVPHVS